MAFKKQASLTGFDRTFEVHPECKPYTLRDNGFVNTKTGNFEYKRPLDSAHKQGLQLKVMVNKNLDQLKISTVTASGLNAVNVMNLENNDMLVEKINFIFDGFVERHCLKEVD
ncbi:cysteine desulfurase [Hutsoniella sourekii]|uniref:cysteine desulfurase n=1 Tax=Hutsoniella sourekii TaxID=87650 RepID=UPI00048147D2|nr:cysteine desulfurase [Hutsoniella sourekii]